MKLPILICLMGLPFLANASLKCSDVKLEKKYHLQEEVIGMTLGNMTLDNNRLSSSGSVVGVKYKPLLKSSAALLLLGIKISDFPHVVSIKKINKYDGCHLNFRYVDGSKEVLKIYKSSNNGSYNLHSLNDGTHMITIIKGHKTKKPSSRYNSSSSSEQSTMKEISAEDFCKEEFIWSDDKKECRALILGKSFDGRALGVCSEFSFSSSKFECIDAIANKNYTEEVLKECSDKSFPTVKVSCLSSKGTASSSEQSTMKEVSAEDFCKKEVTWSDDRKECRALILGKSFDERAVGVCSEYTFSRFKLECIDVIANKNYTVEVLKECSDMSFPSLKNSCLSSKGTDN